MRVTVYVGQSADGFIARPDGTLDFLDRMDPVDHDMGFGEFMHSVDALVMGRNSFDFVMNSGHPWPYGDTPVIVVTSRPCEIPAALRATVETTSLDPAALRDHLADRGRSHLYVDGAMTARTWLHADLVTDLVLTSVPVLVGEGLRVFGPLEREPSLRHVDTTVFENGCVQTHWAIVS